MAYDSFRWLLLGGVLLGLILQQPLVITALFLVLLPATLLGQRASLIFKDGMLLPAANLPTVERQDPALQRFNNFTVTI